MMQLARSRLRYGAALALFALTLQFAVSFAHIHKDELIAGFDLNHWVTSHVSRSSLPAADAPARPDPDSDHDTDSGACAICATLALAASLVLTAPPAMPVILVRDNVWLPAPVAVLVLEVSRSQIRARGPPA